MKKFLCIALTLAMLLSLVLCVPAFAYNNTYSDPYGNYEIAYDFDSATNTTGTLEAGYARANIGSIVDSVKKTGRYEIYGDWVALMSVYSFVPDVNADSQPLSVSLHLNEIGLANIGTLPDNVVLLHGEVKAKTQQESSRYQETEWNWVKLDTAALEWMIQNDYLILSVDSLSPFVFATEIGTTPTNPGGNNNNNNNNTPTNPGGNNNNNTTNPGGNNNNNTTNPGVPGVSVPPNSGAPASRPNYGPYYNPDPSAPTLTQNGGASSSADATGSNTGVSDANPNTGAAFALLPILPLTAAAGVAAVVCRKKK